MCQGLNKREWRRVIIGQCVQNYKWMLMRHCVCWMCSVNRPLFLFAIATVYDDSMSVLCLQPFLLPPTCQKNQSIILVLNQVIGDCEMGKGLLIVLQRKALLASFSSLIQFYRPQMYCEVQSRSSHQFPVADISNKDALVNPV